MSAPAVSFARAGPRHRSAIQDPMPPHSDALLGPQLPLVSLLPFAALLAGIAVIPLFAPHWRHSNRTKAIVALLASLPVLWLMGIPLDAPGCSALEHKLAHYFAFIVVLGALSARTWGIH